MAKQITDILTDKKITQVTNLKDLETKIELPTGGIIEKIKVGAIYTFKSVLKGKNNSEIEDSVVAVQYYDYTEEKWVTVGTSAIKEGVFSLNYRCDADFFPVMPLFRLANNLSLNEKLPKAYHYGGVFSVEKIVSKISTITTTVDFGEIIVVDKSDIKKLPIDAIDNAVLVGVPAYLANFLTGIEQEKPIEPEYMNTNPNAVGMPNLIGLTETACSQLLLSIGLKLDSIYQYFYTEDIATGQAIKQSVEAGTYVNRGEVITVVFAKK